MKNKTYRDKLMEMPKEKLVEAITGKYPEAVIACPHDFGFCENNGYEHCIEMGSCEKCWNAEAENQTRDATEAKPCPVDRGKLIVGIGCHINDEDRCGECPYIPKDDNDPCIKNLCMDALAYIGYLEEVANEKIH